MIGFTICTSVVLGIIIMIAHGVHDTTWKTWA